MTVSIARRRRPSLTRAIWGFVVLGAVLAALGSWFVVNERLADFRESALAAAVTTRARGVEIDFARTLHRQWLNARAIADDISQRDPASVRSSLDLVVGQSVSWAGIATLDGTVMAASGGLLESRNVASRPWFQRGLEGNFAGDVHEAVLLADLLPSTDGEPRRFLDLATPIRDAQGRIESVLGLHLDYGWAREHLRETARALDLDVFLVNRDGAVVMSTDESVGTTLDLPSIRAATTGASLTSVERWPDGTSYLTSVIPQVGYADLPSFGWSLVARINNDAIAARSFSNTLIMSLTIFGLLLGLMTFLFVQMFARPFQRLADSARSVMRGEEIYPYESQSTAEVQTLSAAVARLQHAQSQDRRESASSA